jgi:hypothetical protein
MRGIWDMNGIIRGIENSSAVPIVFDQLNFSSQVDLFSNGIVDLIVFNPLTSKNHI